MRHYCDWHKQPPHVVLAGFKKEASSLAPGEKMELSLWGGVESLSVVLADPDAHKIGSLDWRYWENSNQLKAIPLLRAACPELTALSVNDEGTLVYDFVAGLLRSGARLQELVVPLYVGGDIPGFFAALAVSPVTKLFVTLGDSPKFARRLDSYLESSHLVILRVTCKSGKIPSFGTSCTRLTDLSLDYGRVSSSTALPRFLTKLQLFHCKIAEGVVWDLPSVRELRIYTTAGIDWGALGRGLPKLESLSLHSCDDADAAVAAMPLHQLIFLEVDYILNADSIKHIVSALQRGVMKTLRLWYGPLIPLYLSPALPCSALTKLKLQSWRGVFEVLELKFRSRIRMLTLLQGRRAHGPLRRLPVEMFRLVGRMLLGS